MAIKYGEFNFPKEFGFHGSAGKSHVSGYMRTAYKHGGTVRAKDVSKVHSGKVSDRFEGWDAGYKHGGLVHKYAKGGHAKGDRFEMGATKHEMEATHGDPHERGVSAKEESVERADERAGVDGHKHGGLIHKYSHGGKATTPQCYAFGGMSRAPKVNKAIHAKKHKPTAGMRGLGALGQAAGPSMAPLGAPPGGAPGMTPPPLGAPSPMGMKRGGRHHR